MTAVLARAADLGHPGDDLAIGGHVLGSTRVGANRLTERGRATSLRPAKEADRTLRRCAKFADDGFAVRAHELRKELAGTWQIIEVIERDHARRLGPNEGFMAGEIAAKAAARQREAVLASTHQRALLQAPTVDAHCCGPGSGTCTVGYQPGRRGLQELKQTMRCRLRVSASGT